MNYSNSTAWHSLDAKEVIGLLDSNVSGISEKEVQKRLKEFGPNQIKRKSGDTWIKVLWRQINNPLIWVLIGSSILAVSLGKLSDGLVVLAVVVVNTIIGFIQEFKAGKAIEALMDMVPQNTTVTRDGKTIVVAVSDLVPGDIVHLAAGDRVPADMRLIALKNLQIEEAALTGESVPASKYMDSVDEKAVLGDRSCMVFSGTMVTAGTATAVVTGTGMNTELGRISDMLSETTSLETPLTKKLASLGSYITIGVLVVTLIIMVAGTIRATGHGIDLISALKDSLIFAIALAVAAIPEGLPAVVTIALAIGVQRMAKRKAIIRKLPAVETLGSTTVICSDKTGTLTRNEMTVTETWTPKHTVLFGGAGYKPEGDLHSAGVKLTSVPEEQAILLQAALLCNDAGLTNENNTWDITGDPTEAALLVAAVKAGFDLKKTVSDHPRIDAIPFESENQYMATLNGKDEKWLIMKGAPEVILNRCVTMLGDESLDRQTILEEMTKMGKRGMRVLAVARKVWMNHDRNEIENQDIQSGFEFVGLVGMIDPPRTEAIEAIQACHDAGIVVKMITGDHPATASAIGKELDLDTKGVAISGVELSQMDDEKLSQAAIDTNIFARVAPEHKLRLVKALQKQNHIVAMTGDGVNDAPSLKQSNIGVAMGITGTSVSKESSDIILTDDNFASISAAVEEGRRVYDNLIKSLAFLLPTNLGLALILIWGIMFFPFDPVSGSLLLPMLPTQLLWINLVAAVALALPLAFEAKEPNLMKRPPRDPNEQLFSPFVIFRVFFVSVLMTAGTILLFNWSFSNQLAQGVSEQLAVAKSQTIAVTFVVMFQIFYLLNCRSLKDTLVKIGLLSNTTIFVGIASILVLQAMFVYLPFMQHVFGTTALDAKDIILSALAGFLIFLIIGVEKWIVRKMTNK